MNVVQPEKSEAAHDRLDGGWVARPGRAAPAMEPFAEVLGERPDPVEKQRPDVKATPELLDFKPETPITEAGPKMKVSVGIHCVGAWIAAGLRGNPDAAARRRGLT